MKQVNHYELCEITANRFLGDSDVVLFEYKSIASNEEPDVLCYRYGCTKLFEIKISRSDFLSDKNKECRVKYKNKFYPYRFPNGKIQFKNDLKEFMVEAPHLGSERYYVCPSGLIQPEEVGNWGLYWYNGRFYKKKESGKFRRNIYKELSLVTHALRKYAGLGKERCKNVLIKDYNVPEGR